MPSVLAVSCPWGDSLARPLHTCPRQPWEESPRSRGSSPLHLTSALVQPSADSPIRSNDPACITSKSTQLPKGRLLPNPCPPPGSTSNPAETAGAPCARKNRCPTRTALLVQHLSSATNHAWKPENPSLIRRLKSQNQKRGTALMAEGTEFYHEHPEGLSGAQVQEAQSDRQF